LAIINNALALAGKSPLPISDDTVTQVVSFAFTTGASLVSWWYNNSFTKKAIEADETFK
jgi:SPP1 family holin